MTPIESTISKRSTHQLNLSNDAVALFNDTCELAKEVTPSQNLAILYNSARSSTRFRIESLQDNEADIVNAQLQVVKNSYNTPFDATHKKDGIWQFDTDRLAETSDIVAFLNNTLPGEHTYTNLLDKHPTIVDFHHATQEMFLDARYKNIGGSIVNLYTLASFVAGDDYLSEVTQTYGTKIKREPGKANWPSHHFSVKANFEIDEHKVTKILSIRKIGHNVTANLELQSTDPRINNFTKRTDNEKELVSLIENLKRVNSTLERQSFLS